MKILKDYRGRDVRLTDERLDHILEHPELEEMLDKIEETVRNPDIVIANPEGVHHHYRYYYTTRFGNKWLTVIVKTEDDDAFILTAYLTNRLKKGEVIWKNM